MVARSLPIHIKWSVLENEAVVKTSTSLIWRIPPDYLCHCLRVVPVLRWEEALRVSKWESWSAAG